MLNQVWKIPLFDTDYDQAEIDCATSVIRSGWLTMGEITQRFEERFAEFSGARHAIAVTNCTAALHLATLALGIGAGDEVICPSLSFVAGANSIRYTGAKPVFADIASLDTLCIGPDSIEELITPSTKAIQVMHYAGFPCDMDRIKELAKRHRLYVIEDCAHAPGAELNDRKCGTFGDIGCFSFFSNKNMSTGEGGMLTTNSNELAHKLRLMRSHGMTSLTLDRARGHAFSYDVVETGFNYRIDEIRSAIGLVQLDKLVANNARRRALTEQYRAQLADLDWIQLPFAHSRAGSAYHIFPILLAPAVDRIAFMSYLKERGIQTSIHYPPIHKFSHYAQHGYAATRLPLTEEAASREVTLPLYPLMETAQVDYVVQAINDFSKEKL